MTDLVLQSEYARRRGVSKKTVTKWKQAGRLVLVDGKVDVDATDALLAERKGNGNRRKPDPVTPAEPKPEQPGDDDADDPYIDELAARLDRGEMLTTAEAERIKENYLARKRRLEFDREAGRVVDADAVADVFGQACARVRTRLLGIPTKVAPRLANQSQAPTIEDLVRAEITEALEELSRIDDKPDGGDRDAALRKGA